MLAPSLSKRPAGDELAGVDADRSGERAGLRHEHVAGHRDVIAARRRQVGHRDDDRPLAARRSCVIISSRQITSDAVEAPPGLSMRRTIARIDESARICADVFDDRIRADHRPVDRVVAAAARRDRADGVEHGNLAAAAHAERFPASRARSRRFRPACSVPGPPTSSTRSSSSSSYARSSTSPWRSASSGRSGPSSMAARTSASVLRRPSAIARTS